MKKAILFYLVMTLLPIHIFAQSFTKHSITTGFNRAIFIHAEDIDGDGDMDILGVADVSNTVSWFENDGSENFTKHDLSTTYAFPVSIYAADVNSDGHMDILTPSYGSNKLTWWENDGSENFTQRDITTSFSGAHSIYALDVDGDGDMEILGAASVAGNILYPFLNSALGRISPSTFTIWPIAHPAITKKTYC